RQTLAARGYERGEPRRSRGGMSEAKVCGAKLPERFSQEAGTKPGQGCRNGILPEKNGQPLADICCPSGSNKKKRPM
ncbi:MAG: hypothetical protein ILP04_05295, partial [Bacteroidales bacterium]|nr:hypothetical protein [Bacteroidales bacterium]